MQSDLNFTAGANRCVMLALIHRFAESSELFILSANVKMPNGIREH